MLLFPETLILAVEICIHYKDQNKLLFQRKLVKISQYLKENEPEGLA